MGMSLMSDSGSSRYERTDTRGELVDGRHELRMETSRDTTANFESGKRVGRQLHALNEGQHVNAADATSLADAFELVLLDPDIDSDAANDNDPFVDVRFPGPNDKAGLKELIAFCREGPFTIW